MGSKVAEEVFLASKQASQYFEKIDKNHLYHSVALLETDWYLCDKKGEDSTLWLQGLSPPDVEDLYVIAIPHLLHGKPFSSVELHQIVRELVYGIYVFNQTPSISMETNHDSSVTCQLPSAYVDTLIGQCLFSLDYFVKSLLHGNTIPQRERRFRVNEKWRKVAGENPSGLHGLYEEYGLMNMEDDEELDADLYNDKKPPCYRFPPTLVDPSLSARYLRPRYSTGENTEHQLQVSSYEAFIKHLDHVSLGVSFEQGPLQQDGSLLVFDPSHKVYSKVNVKNVKDDALFYLHVYLQAQIDFVKKHLLKKSSVTRVIELLQFASFLVGLLATLKQKHKIIDCDKLHLSMNTDLLSTDRELPPFLPTKNSRWSPSTPKSAGSSSANGCVTFHKEQINVTPLEEKFSELKKRILTEPKLHDNGPVMVNVDGCVYTLISLKLDNYYPKFPRWAHAMVQELKSQCSKLPPLTDGRVQDFLRRPLGLRLASKLKTINVSLRPCIDKGLTGSASALIKRCTKTRINKLDEEDGMSLIHYASSSGRFEILSYLIHQGADVNQFRHEISSQSASQTVPIHLGTSSGDIDTIGCLLKYGAQKDAVDDKGWYPIHHAAFHNYHPIVAHFVRLDKASINLLTEGKDRATPLLLAAENGGLSTVKYLIEFGGDVCVTDSSGHNIVHIAAIKHHINILQYFIMIDRQSKLLWDTLAEMLRANPSTGLPQSSANCLDSLLRWDPTLYSIVIDIGIIKQLIDLAQSENEQLNLLSVQVLSDVSCEDPIKDIIVSAIPVFIKHLSASNDRLQSCSCIVLCDLAFSPANQTTIAEGGAIKYLIDMLKSPEDDIQLYSSACLGILAMDNSNIKDLIRDANGLSPLISLLSSSSICIQGSAAACLQVLLDRCYESQLAALSDGIVEPLVNLLKSKAISVHTNATCAIESLAKHCLPAQNILINEATSFNCLMYLRRLLKTRNPDVKVCSASAMWAIAGCNIKSRRHIANFMGIDTLVDLLTTPNDKLYFACSEALGTLATELGENQNVIAELGGILPLVDVILCQTSEEVYISVLNTLGLLLTKPGLVPNTRLQKAVVDARGISLISALVSSPLSEVIRVKSSCTLAKMVLNNPEYEKKLTEQPGFSHYSLVKLLGSSDVQVRLLAGYALSIFVFNNSEKLQMLKSHGGLNVSNIVNLLSFEDESHQAHGAFQLVMLSKLLVGVRDVEASIHGIKMLVKLLNSPLESTKLCCCNFLACLGRCKEGIPTTTIMGGAITPLLDCLLSDNPPLEEVASAAIGFFTYEPLASRLIRSRFRSNPTLYAIFRKYLQYINFSHDFMNEWLYVEKVGLPSMR
jgi:hypothetical protein